MASRTRRTNSARWSSGRSAIITRARLLRQLVTGCAQPNSELAGRFIMLRSLAFTIAVLGFIAPAAAQIGCQQIGGQTFCNNGQTFSTYGNQTYDNRGNSCYGNQTYGPGGPYSSYGNQTY